MPPADIGPYAKSSWAVSAPEAFPPVGGLGSSAFGKQDWFSAACYFFGRDVYVSQNGSVPIGLMASDWGGQPIQPFMSPDALADTTCGGTHNTTTTVNHSKAHADSENATALEARSDTGSGNSVLWW